MNDLREAPLKLTINEGDSYVDQYVAPTRSARSVNVDVLKPRPIASKIRALFGEPVPQPITIRTERIRVRWMKLDGKGGLEPKC